MTRVTFFALVALLYVAAAFAGVMIMLDPTHPTIRMRWDLDDNGIALVARRDLRRNQIVRDADLKVPPSVPALFHKYAAPAPKGKYLLHDVPADHPVRASDLGDQPVFKSKKGHAYIAVAIDADTAGRLVPSDRIEFHEGTKTLFSSCIEAITPSSVIFAVPDENIAQLNIKKRIVFVQGGKPCR